MEPIQNDEEHAKALARIEALWNAEVCTSEGDEVEALTAAVEAYERVHHPIEPVPAEVVSSDAGVRLIRPLLETRAASFGPIGRAQVIGKTNAR
ncbi:MAG: hypothetical protein HYV07_23315 [Deltaproteobacteria bacterium]|nr:hypothetical protein [Deltaproteobacteria bacterium]